MYYKPANQTKARTHELKTIRPYFAAVFHGQKTAELRKHDRAYQVGDTLVLREYLPDEHHFTGSRVVAEVTHIVTYAEGPWLADGYCLLSFKVKDLLP